MRLIDADELLKEIKEYEDGCKMLLLDVDPRVIKQYITFAPTVNQWYYPSKGEYPKEGDKYLVVLFKDDEEPHIAEVKDGWFKHPVFSEYLCPCDSDTVFAWQYIVPPKEEA